MKRILSGLIAFVLCLSMTCTAFAAGFVPSITYKPAPDVVTTPGEDGKEIIGHIVDPDGNVLSTEHEDCIVITPVADAETTTKIPKETAQLLLDLYNEIVSGEKVLVDGYVVKDMFDITALCDDLKTLLPIDGNTIDLTFDVGVDANCDVKVMVYVDGKWQEIKVKNNGDGTITCTFEDFGQVAILVPEDAAAGTEDAPTTGDNNSTQIVMWSVIAGISLAAIVGATMVYRRKVAE